MDRFPYLYLHALFTLAPFFPSPRLLGWNLLNLPSWRSIRTLHRFSLARYPRSSLTQLKLLKNVPMVEIPEKILGWEREFWSIQLVCRYRPARIALKLFTWHRKRFASKKLFGTNTFSQPLMFVATSWFQPSSFATIIQYHILIVATCVDKRRQSHRFDFGLSSCSIWKPADVFSHTKWECGFCWLGLAWEHVGISFASSCALQKSWGEPHAIQTNSENVSGEKSYSLVFCWVDWLFKSFC